MERAIIATWFVSDEPAHATFFPQLGTLSHSPDAKNVYWRCAVAFYASSLRLNPTIKHVFFTNTELPIVDGLDIAKIFEQWSIELIKLEISHRLPQDSVASWGNQFYIFDILNYLVENPIAGIAIILDSDVIWLKPVSEMLEEIAKEGALTYRMGLNEYPKNCLINGRSREQLAEFFSANGGGIVETIDYNGGEIYAARQDVTERIATRAKTLWPKIAAGARNAPLEEAHFLSLLYALENIQQGTANRFIKRMWTTFKHNNLSPDDVNLVIWHLPAEKKTGFGDLFLEIVASPPDRRSNPMRIDALEITNYARLMGFPRRNKTKFVRDAWRKIIDKIYARWSVGVRRSHP